MAGDPGFEPGHADPESAVLPLDESPVPAQLYHEGVTQTIFSHTIKLLRVQYDEIPGKTTIPGSFDFFRSVIPWKFK